VSIDPATHFASFNAVVIVTDHALLEHERLLREATLVVDTRDALRDTPGDRRKAYGL
jgi:UDP-N-acetyl-D-mannosaminuronate dehydrogenase